MRDVNMHGASVRKRSAGGTCMQSIRGSACAKKPIEVALAVVVA
jgi:hypothetical protein